MAFNIIYNGSSITLADEDFRHAVHVESRKIRDFITNYAEEAAAGKTFDAADDPRNIAWRCQEALKLARSYILTRFNDFDDHVAALWTAKRDLIAYSDNPDLAYGVFESFDPSNQPTTLPGMLPREGGCLRKIFHLFGDTPNG